MVSRILGIFFAWTWPVWAFVFVFCLVSAIARAVRERSDGEDKGATLFTFWAALSLAVILGGMVSVQFL